MSQVSRSLKNLEAPRPLKSNNANRQTHLATPAYELQTSMYKPIQYDFCLCFFFACILWKCNLNVKLVSISVEELITLVENVADSVSIGQCNPDSMALLLSNLRILGPQLEEYSKSTLDQGMIYLNSIIQINLKKKIKQFFSIEQKTSRSAAQFLEFFSRKITNRIREYLYED